MASIAPHDRAGWGCGSTSLIRLRRLLRNEQGVVAVEFAFVLVVFLSILFGIMMFGFQFAGRVALSYAVAEGGRSAMVGLTSQERQQRAGAAVNRVLTSMSPLIDPSKAVVDVTSEGVTEEGEVIDISVTYHDNRFNVFPFMPSLNSDRAVETSFLITDPSG